MRAMPKYQLPSKSSPHYLPEQSAPEAGPLQLPIPITITKSTPAKCPAQLIVAPLDHHQRTRRDRGGQGPGRGIGQQPLLASPAESFEYTSGCRVLRTPSGSMQGSYFCVAEDGERFEVEIPLFVLLPADIDGLRNAFFKPERDDAQLQAAIGQYRERLDACRQAVNSIYTHLEDNGISVGMVFRLRQLRERILRVRELLDSLLSPKPAMAAVKLLGRRVITAQEGKSIGALISANSTLLSAKVAERSAETGETYITRTRGEYREMLGKAMGGGAVTAFTTLLKFMIVGIGLSAFWGGFWSGVMYAASFIVIQLLHFTLATKQPAMTAPAMAAKLKDLGSADAAGTIEAFVDEVAHLVRSQVAAVFGNVFMVVPAVLLVNTLIQLLLGRPMISNAEARHVLGTLTLLGPTLMWAGFTGGILFAASMIAGWTENWFVLHRLDSAMRHNPRITAFLGGERAARWSTFMRDNISGFASNIALGFMLGLIPPFTGFFGVELEARHVTLSTGQLAAAGASLGLDAFRHLPIWWCIAAIPLIGALNLGVSFYLAFRLALQAHNVSNVDRARIRAAIWARWRSHPRSFFTPE
jgi:site-specific recombinase/uncharacterized protein affecting Mg2+/Co2+ transport